MPARGACHVLPGFSFYLGFRFACVFVLPGFSFYLGFRFGWFFVLAGFSLYLGVSFYLCFRFAFRMHQVKGLRR